jgi:hypothetical protein
MVWRILAEGVMSLHLLIIGFVVVSAVLLATGFFKARRNWQYLYYGVIVLALGVAANSWLGMWKSCPFTALEYTLRRQYDPTESWIRTRSILGTVVSNVTGGQVPEYVFTIILGTGIVVMISSLIFWRFWRPTRLNAA